MRRDQNCPHLSIEHLIDPGQNQFILDIFDIPGPAQQRPGPKPRGCTDGRRGGVIRNDPDILNAYTYQRFLNQPLSDFRRIHGNFLGMNPYPDNDLFINIGCLSNRFQMAVGDRIKTSRVEGDVRIQRKYFFA